MKRPGKLYKQGQQGGTSQGVAGVIEEPDGQKAKNERVRRPPEPEVLMEQIDKHYKRNKNESLHPGGVSPGNKRVAANVISHRVLRIATR